MRGASAWILAGALFALGPAASAADPPRRPPSADVRLAQSLFEESRTLMKSGRYTEACPKLAESQRLDPAGGTLLNLGVCHEMVGRTATAWTELHEALSIATRERRDERARVAREHLASLDARLSKLTVVRGEGAGGAEVDVRLDGAPIRDASFGTATPVDPGRHRVEASAPGKKPWSTELLVADSGDHKVVVPALDDAPRVVAPPLAVARSGSTQKTAGLLVGGAGVAAMGVGLLAGVQAASKWSARRDQCPGDVCNAAGLDADTAARRWARVADVALVIGAIGVTVGTVLVITAKSGSSRVELRAAAGPSQAGVSLVGAF